MSAPSLSLLSLASAACLSSCVVYPHMEHKSPQVRGRVVDAVTRGPVAGARVAFDNEPRLKAKTDTAGQFVIRRTARLEPFMFLGVCGPDVSVWKSSFPNGVRVMKTGYREVEVPFRDRYRRFGAEVPERDQGLDFGEIRLVPTPRP